MKALVVILAIFKSCVPCSDATTLGPMDNLLHTTRVPHSPSQSEVLLQMIKALLHFSNVVPEEHLAVDPTTTTTSTTTGTTTTLTATAFSAPVTNGTSADSAPDEAKDSDKEEIGELWLLSDICHLQPLVGHCKGRLQRFYWDIKERTCKMFTYGGCGGNVNNFLTEQDCMDSCNHTSSPFGAATMQLGHSRCFLQARTGDCRAKFPRYFFNANAGKCQLFNYGGCKGNKNNFKSFQHCQSSCSTATPQSICQMPSELPGPSCMAKMTRYYFNVTSGSCEKFFYGGCHSSANNFQSENQCQNLC